MPVKPSGSGRGIRAFGGVAKARTFTKAEQALPYDPRHVESKWQKYWDENQTFRVEMDKTKAKLYVLDMFPYPSGEGLHVGHPEGYTATDIFCRYKRMRGFNVLHPMGWDAFGLPAERYAVRTGVHPAITTKKNIDTFRGQIKRLGFSYDWSREISIQTTSDGRNGFFCNSTRMASPISRRSPSTGARRKAPCSRTKKCGMANISRPAIPSNGG
jgi:hypothetical protein